MGNRKIIDAAFTREVQTLLSDGYQFFTPSMAGHQVCEIGKADFIKGTRLVRVLLQSFVEHKNGMDLEGYELIVGPWDWKNHNFGHAPTYQFGSSYTCFNEHFIPDKTIRFYQLGENRWSGGYGTRDDAIAAQKKRRNRSRRGGYKVCESWKPRPEKMDEAKGILLPLIRNIPGLKTVKLKDIDDVCRDRYKPYGADNPVPRWYCYVRGKRFDYDGPLGVYYGGKQYIKNSDSSWICLS